MTTRLRSLLVMGRVAREQLDKEIIALKQELRRKESIYKSITHLYYRNYKWVKEIEKRKQG